MGVAELLKKRKEELANRNLLEGEKFLKEFSKLENVVVLPEGIVYQVLSLGTGEFIKLEDKFECHYEGVNVNGDVFDSSILKGKPAVFKLNKLIKAYQIVVPKLPIGTKFKMVTPAEYAYREEHISKEIGPNSTLIFEVELLRAVTE